MKSKKKKSLSFIFTGMLLGMLAGCSLFTFDASGYVKACLDANAHGEFAAYAEMTGYTPEEVEQQYNDLMDQEISYLDSYNASDETKQKFRDLFIRIYGQFKYEVGEATKNEDNTYSVPVTIYKLNVFQDVMDKGEDYITDYVQKEYDAGNTLSEDDLYQVVLDFMYDELSANLAKADYAEPETTTVLIAPTSEGSNIYTISTAELQDLLESMIDMENAQ